MGVNASVALALIMTACGGGGGSNDDGEVGGHCYPNGTCNVGLTCVEGVCQPSDAGPVDSDPGDAENVDAPGDGPSAVCNDDSSFENNDTPQSAFVTPVASTQVNVTYDDLAICPATDRDHFQVVLVTANSSLEALVTYDDRPVDMSILNAGGVAINDARPTPYPLTVSFDTTAVGGTYSPQNCEVVWIENSQGTFVRTIGRWCGTRKAHLVAWSAKASVNDVDGLSGATRANHAARLTATWDRTDFSGNLAPDGSYVLRMETTDTNATMATQNHQASFAFTTGSASQVQSGLSNGGHANVDIAFEPRPTLRALAANLPVGTYFVRVRPVGVASGPSNYSLTINVLPPSL